MDLAYCDGCHQVMPAIFFKFIYIRNKKLHGATAYCYGCCITKYLDEETDHYKIEKHNILAAWLSDPIDEKYPEAGCE